MARVTLPFMPTARPTGGPLVPALLLLGAALAPSTLAQRAEPLTAARARALVREAEAEARGDRDDVILGLDRRVREGWGDFESFPVAVLRREDLTITLTTPFMGFRRTAIEYLRMRQPPADAAWVDAVVVAVSPERLEAPDITSVAVERDGTPVAPLSATLRPMTFQNGRGETAVIHAGEIHFPLSAFLPGATVTVRAVAKTGEAFERTLRDAELAALK
jgi:hypothetical protein